MWEKLKGVTGRLDKPALIKSIALMLMSWTALPIIYWLLVRKNRPVKEVEKDESTDNVEEEKENG